MEADNIHLWRRLHFRLLSTLPYCLLVTALAASAGRCCFRSAAANAAASFATAYALFFFFSAAAATAAATAVAAAAAAAAATATAATHSGRHPLPVTLAGKQIFSYLRR